MAAAVLSTTVVRDDDLGATVVIGGPPGHGVARQPRAVQPQAGPVAQPEAETVARSAAT